MNPEPDSVINLVARLLMKRHNGTDCHQNRGGVHASGRVRRLPDYRLGGRWREVGVSVE